MYGERLLRQQQTVLKNIFCMGKCPIGFIVDFIDIGHVFFEKIKKKSI